MQRLELERPAADETSRAVRRRLRRTYSRTARFYDFLDLPFEYGRYRRIRPLVFEAVGGVRRLLDCGVGTGRNVPYYPAGADVVGIDLSGEMISRARRRASRVGQPATWVQADIVQLPFATASFDAATATFLFCVLPDELQPAALAELSRVVRPGGLIVLLEYVLSRRPARRWIMQRVWAPWVRFAFAAGFDRRTTEHVRTSGLTIDERRFVYADTMLLLVAANHT